MIDLFIICKYLFVIHLFCVTNNVLINMDLQKHKQLIEQQVASMKTQINIKMQFVINLFCNVSKQHYNIAKVTEKNLLIHIMKPLELHNLCFIRM